MWQTPPFDFNVLSMWPAPDSVFGLGDAGTLGENGAFPPGRDWSLQKIMPGTSGGLSDVQVSSMYMYVYYNNHYIYNIIYILYNIIYNIQYNMYNIHVIYNIIYI